MILVDLATVIVFVITTVIVVVIVVAIAVAVAVGVVVVVVVDVAAIVFSEKDGIALAINVMKANIICSLGIL